MSDFPDLGSEFATAPSSAISASGGDLDFDRAASAFPDISLDGDDFSTPTGFSAPTMGGGGSGFSFDDFDSPPARDIKVTGDDEIEKFEDQFPELDVPGPQVGNLLVSLQYYCNGIDVLYCIAINVAALKTHLWCCPSFCASSAAVIIHHYTYLQSTTGRGGATGYQVSTRRNLYL